MVNDYLRDFGREALKLARDGVKFRWTTIFVSNLSFICDFPAKSFITSEKDNTGYFGSTKCETKGTLYNLNVNNLNPSQVTFPQLNAFPRTDQCFRGKLLPEHHHGVILLEKPDIDLISGIWSHAFNRPGGS